MKNKLVGAVTVAAVVTGAVFVATRIGPAGERRGRCDISLPDAGLERLDDVSESECQQEGLRVAREAARLRPPPPGRPGAK